MDLLVYDSHKTDCSSACVDMVESTMPFGRHFLALLMATPQSTEQKTVLFEERRYISGYLQHLLLRRSPHKAGGLCAEPFSLLSGWTGTSGKEEHYMAKNSISRSIFLILKEYCQSGALASTYQLRKLNCGKWNALYPSSRASDEDAWTW